uniref:LO4 n=1 Tax=Grenadier adomavirus TaxID=2609868 RepID=A0A6F9F0H6_9VIRU|nr:TPA_asm: LO4 [Grenadier adomavirus]
MGEVLYGLPRIIRNTGTTEPIPITVMAAAPILNVEPTAPITVTAAAPIVNVEATAPITVTAAAPIINVEPHITVQPSATETSVYVFGTGSLPTPDTASLLVLNGRTDTPITGANPHPAFTFLPLTVHADMVTKTDSLTEIHQFADSKFLPKRVVKKMISEELGKIPAPLQTADVTRLLASGLDSAFRSQATRYVSRAEVDSMIDNKMSSRKRRSPDDQQTLITTLIEQAIARAQTSWTNELTSEVRLQTAAIGRDFSRRLQEMSTALTARIDASSLQNNKQIQTVLQQVYAYLPAAVTTAVTAELTKRGR